MSGEKIEQAKDAMKYIFRNLNDNDRFSLITFSTDVYPYFEGWRDASRGNTADVVDYIDGLDAGGSTNIEAAFSNALDLATPSDRPFYIVFVSDGLPTVGQTNTADIIEDLSIRNRDIDARIFCFGLGDDVDYPFIDRLAKENNGYTANVAPSQDLEQPLSDFYSKIKSPVMTDIDLEISGVRIYDQIPDHLSDLFLGSQLVVTGRYMGSGRGNIALAGRIGGEQVTYNYPVQFTDSRQNDFIPRHWATRRVGYLLNQIRLYGENQEVVDEVVQLARRYGIITPYTSMLVTEDEKYPPFPQPLAEDRMSYSLGGGSAGGVGGGFAPPAGVAREQSSDLMQMESGEATPTAPPEEAEGSVRYAGDKTFYKNADGFWEDSEFADSGIEPTEIPYLSQEYYDLIAAEPDLAQYLGVGEKVILVWNDKAYKIVSNEEEPAEPSPAAAPTTNDTSDDSKSAPAVGGCGSVSAIAGPGGGSSHVLPLWAFLVFCATASIVIRLTKLARRPLGYPTVA
jgi:Ca-activated chloride channel family protein